MGDTEGVRGGELFHVKFDLQFTRRAHWGTLAKAGGGRQDATRSTSATGRAQGQRLRSIIWKEELGAVGRRS